MEIQSIRRAFSAVFRSLEVVGVVMALLLSTAHAATFTVTSLANSGGICSGTPSGCTLRQAILTANTTVGDDTIVFQSGLSGTITLTSGELRIENLDKLTIHGPGADKLTISGNNASRVFRILSSSGAAVIEGLTIKNGQVGNDWGGGIYNQGTLTVNSSILSYNRSDYNGGGICNRGKLTISNSILDHNTADDLFGRGGGLYNNSGVEATIINSTLSHNSAGYDGGGIYNAASSSGGKLKISHSTLFDNRAINRGGGIYNNYPLTVSNSTLSGNQATLGSGINNQAELTVLNSTLSDNEAAQQGGGIYLSGGSSGRLTLGNSIVAGNRVTTGADSKQIMNTTGTFISQGYNLFGENGASGVVGGTLAGSDRILPASISTAISRPLANNGGPTLTYHPVAGSLAIDHGNNALAQAAGLTTDQRGPGFPRIVNNIVEIGAVELCDPNLKLIPTPFKPIFGPAGGGGAFTIVTTSQCPWAARSTVSWITLTSSTSGTGTGTVTFTVAPNPTANPRSGAIAVAQKTATVFQRAGYQIDPPGPLPPKR